MKYSVVIATYNRARELADTLEGLARLQCSEPWEAIVVDNNSTDDTRQVVEAAAPRFPVPLVYLFEAEQGKAAALNTAIRKARGEIIAFTDDDAIVEPDWLDRTGAALDSTQAAYVGGRALPRWEKEAPRWLPRDHRTRLWAVIALLDYGDQRREFGEGIGWPLGVNMAVRSDVFHVHGMWWDKRYDRIGNTLRGQGQREWCLRLRAAGLRGFYSPEMVVHHLVAAERLAKPYFRRWFYWFGITRAIMYANHGLDMESPDERKFDFAAVPHIAGVPRYMYRGALYHLRESLRSAMRGDAADAFEHELMVYFFAGVLRQRWSDRRAPIGAPASVSA